MRPEILLKAYVQYQSDDAFREIVASSLDEVYSIALRIIHGPENLIEEAVLRTYWQLARKAPRLPDDVVLASWLREHVCKMAVAVLHEEDRSVDRIVLKTEKETLATQKSVRPAPRGLATRVCQGILLSTARNRRPRFLPRLFWPACIRPAHVGIGVVCVLAIIGLRNIPFHRRNPIILAPELQMTPASFAQLASPEEGAPTAEPIQMANTNGETKLNQK
jgi:hypothetical protein